MRFVLKSTLMIVMVLSLCQCDIGLINGNGKITTLDIPCNSFQSVSIGGNYNLELIPSKSEMVLIETDDNLFKYINVEVKGNTLHVNNVHHLKSSKGINIKVLYEQLTSINSSGASKITHLEILHSPQIGIHVSGAGSVELEAQTERITINMTGAGVVKLAGEATYMDATISGVGGLSAMDLITDQCSILVTGVGGATVFVKEKLEASITGIGGITYGGKPSMIEKKITGLGKIKQADESPS